MDAPEPIPVSSSWEAGSNTRWRRFRARVLARDGYRCKVTLPGCTGAAPLNGGHVDHVIPLHQGGERYSEDNVRASCASCNLKRGKGSERHDPTPTPVTTW